jgi:hypothetical protein
MTLSDIRVKLSGQFHPTWQTLPTVRRPTTPTTSNGKRMKPNAIDNTNYSDVLAPKVWKLAIETEMTMTVCPYTVGPVECITSY